MYATVAQLVEHGTHKPGVVGSIPTRGTSLRAGEAARRSPEAEVGCTFTKAALRLASHFHFE